METKMWNSTITRGQLGGAISALQELNRVPEQPQEHVPRPMSSSTHRLTAERENEIVGNLAFLSAISDNHLEIMAVCVEEDPDVEKVTIRFASNTGDLAAVTSGFKELARTLEKAASRLNSRSEDIDVLFRQIIGWDFHRILSRLRSRHADITLKTAGKPALITQLNEALNHRSIRASSKSAKPSLVSLRSMARTLCDTFDRLEALRDFVAKKSEACELLEKIVIVAHEITVAATLGEALQHSLIDPSLKTHLPEAIGKVGRYYSAASELVCAARDLKCPVFRNIQIEPFQITIPSFIKETGIKVHAEIQLLFFYEIHRDRPRPRTICSSKSACYLCNLFFHHHGEFHTPRTHGKLYSKWTLPDWVDIPMERREQLSTVLTKFTTALDKRIKKASRSRGRKYSHPNESFLPPLAFWPSSSALSGRMVSSHASQATIRPPTPKGSPRRVLSCAELPLTLPQTPPMSPLSVTASVQADIDKDLGEARSVESPLTTDIMSTISIGYEELPYTQLIVLTTPLLFLKLNKLSITFEFIQVVSGKLTVTQECSSLNGEDYQVNAEDIPTDTEMKLNCSRDSRTLELRLGTASMRSIYITFVWDE